MLSKHSTALQPACISLIIHAASLQLAITTSNNNCLLEIGLSTVAQHGPLTHYSTPLSLMGLRGCSTKA